MPIEDDKQIKGPMKQEPVFEHVLENRFPDSAVVDAPKTTAQDRAKSRWRLNDKTTGRTDKSWKR